MLLMENRDTLRTEITCSCGRKAELKYGPSAFSIANKEIKVLNIPHYNCPVCDTTTFDSSIRVDNLLITAYKNGLEEIDWDKREQYL